MTSIFYKCLLLGTVSSVLSVNSYSLSPCVKVPGFDVDEASVKSRISELAIRVSAKNGRDSLMERAQCYWVLEDFVNAKNDLEVLITDIDVGVEELLLFANVNVKLGKCTNAVPVLNKAIELRPEDISLYIESSEILAQCGLVSDARATLLAGIDMREKVISGMPEGYEYKDYFLKKLKGLLTEVESMEK